MSTPMRHGPSQQGRTPSQHPGAAPTPQASTPFSNPQTQAAFSPHGPRSSPQQFKKSPAAKNSPAMAPSASTMGHSVNQPVNFDSPTAAAALGALGINDLGLDTLSMGGLVGGTGRADEDDRKRRMDEVIKILMDANSARVSNDSLERLAKQLDLDSIWEDVIGGEKNAKTLIIAGSIMSVEIGITEHTVNHAALAFNEPIAIVDKHVDRASEVLKRDLSLAPNQSPLTKYLTQFKANLKRLATLDKLSVSPGLNCHEAVAGIYESLVRLHRWDLEKLREDPSLSGQSEDKLKVYALCTRHGYPQMHTRGQIGLSLDYWKDKRKLPSTTVDTDDDRKTWAIKIGCGPINSMDYTPMSNMAYTPVRVSEKWIGPDIEKSDPTNEDIISATGPVLDWLEPENTILPPTEELKSEEGLEPDNPMSGPKTPEVVFLATFDPPVIVTQAVAMDIYKLCATEPHLSSATFDVLQFPIPEGSAYDPSEPRMVEHTRTVATFPGVKEGQTEPDLKTHMNTLHIYKPVYGQILREVPFSHPKELVQMLPTLRQYAFLSTLLFNSFKRQGPSAPKATKGNDKSKDSSVASTIGDDFSRFMSQASKQPATTAVDITLTVHPVTRLQIVFPFRSKTANIHIEIQPGGRVHIVSHNIFGDIDETNGGSDGGEAESANSKGKSRSYTVAQWAAMLETAEDISCWIEWIKCKLE
ncbi:hypothetical protein DL769_004943 [Monosporascus sp. CRB-8-3]|nr:hypothetical protein DL769_004943 [Monosporascus sp. CRB-8-3]